MRLTPAMIKAFNEEDDDTLRRLLNLKPWELSPLDYELGEECTHPPGTAAAKSWPQAQAMRRRLESQE